MTTTFIYDVVRWKIGRADVGDVIQRCQRCNNSLDLGLKKFASIHIDTNFLSAEASNVL